MEDLKNNILYFIMKHDKLISIISTLVLYTIFFENIESLFENQKQDLLAMIISLAGTLIGFTLTFLSVFLVFKTDDKYIKNEENKNKPLIRLINNKEFSSIYDLYLNNAYSVGITLLTSIIYYFIDYKLIYENYVFIYINKFFIIIILFFMILSIIRIILSIYLFNNLVRILVKLK